MFRVEDPLSESKVINKGLSFEEPIKKEDVTAGVQKNTDFMRYTLQAYS